MRLLLIRHGETEHNVAGLLAGVTDSRLTNHGVIQAQRLGTHLVQKRGLHFTHIFSSDLQRAARTAKAICDVQHRVNGEGNVSTLQLALLREQDFGSFELLPWNRSDDAREKDPHPEQSSFRPKESVNSMKSRATEFLTDCIFPLIKRDGGGAPFCVAVVSHGLFLAVLWKAFLSSFEAAKITLGPDVQVLGPARPLEYLPAWNNTGFLELLITESTTAGANAEYVDGDTSVELNVEDLELSLKILAVNSKDHLLNLKRTRGGLGSSPSDDKQKSLDGFFKRPRFAK